MLQRDTRKKSGNRYGTVLIHQILNMIFFCKKLLSEYKFPEQLPSVFRTEAFGIKKTAWGLKRYQVPTFLTKKCAFANYSFYFYFFFKCVGKGYRKPIN